MSDVKPDVRSIFCEALEKKSLAEVGEYLDGVCAHDAELRAQVEALLNTHGEVGDFLGGGASELLPTTDEPITEHAGSVIGPYKLLQQIGEGGMGVVYMAEQTEPVERRVALKIIKLGMDTRQVIARFEAERQALAMMDHPNITKVLDAGVTDSGRPYFVMELIKGMPITDYCDEQHLTARKRLELFLPVCRAVQHAHQKGIIHRDLKPSNVMVAMYDDQPVPKVIDFGVVKATSQKLTEKTMFTQYGQIVGTLEYMSPEQAKLNQLDIDTRSDIYSLGVLLYELLTGTTPFDKQRLRSSAFEEIMRIIHEEEPPKPSTRLRSSTTSPAVAANRGTEPRKLSALIHGELDWIVMKALEKDRTRRYETASGLAADIEHYLNDEQVVACPPSAAYRFRKFVRRHTAVMTTAAIVTTALLLGTIVSTWQAIRATKAEVVARRERNAALEAQSKANQAAAKEMTERLRAQQAESHIRRQAYVTDMAYGCRLLRDGDTGPIANLLDRHLSDSIDLRGLEWYYLWRHWHTDVLKLPHWGTVTSFAFSPDGKMLATGCGDIFTVGEIKLWEPASGRLLGSINGLDGAPTALAFSSDGKTLASRRGPIQLWDVQKRTEISTLEMFWTLAYDVAFSPDGRSLAVVGETLPDQTGLLRLFDVNTGKELSASMDHERKLQMVDFSPRGDSLAAIDDQGRLLLWNTNDGQLPSAVPVEPVGRVTCFRFAPDSLRLAIGNTEGAIHVLDLATHQLLGTYRYHNDAINGVAFSLLGDRIVSSSADALAVWDGNSNAPIETYPGTGQTASTISPDGTMIAYGTDRRLVQVRRLDQEAEITSIDMHDGAGGFAQDRLLEFSPNGRTLASVRAGEVAICDTITGNKITSQSVPGWRKAIGFGFFRDGKALAASLQGTKLKLWDVETGNDIKTFLGDVHSAAFSDVTSCIVVSPDDRTVALGGFDGRLWLWDIGSGRLLGVGTEHQRSIFCIAFSADGETVATGGQDATIHLWERDTCTPCGALRGHTEVVQSVAFSPTDKNTLASGSADKTVKLWNLDTRQPRATLDGHSRRLWALSFSPDGRRLVANGPGHVKLWNPSTGEAVGSIGSTEAYALAFSPDGKKLATRMGQNVQFVRFASEDEVTAELEQRPVRAKELRREIETINVAKQAVLSWHKVGQMGEKLPFEQRKQLLETALRQLETTPDYYATYAPRVCARLASVLSKAPNEQLRANARISQLMTEAFRLAPDDPDLWLELARIRSNQEDWPAACEALEAAVTCSAFRDMSLNALAWFLATCPDVQMRDPVRSVQHAREAVDLRPSQSSFWNTLGVALYRQGKWQDAIDALTKSHETEKHERVVDRYFFLAMSHWRLQNNEQARKWYAKAVEQMETENIAGKDDELRRFRLEASQLLNIAE